MYTDLRLYISNRFLVPAVTTVALKNDRRCHNAFRSNDRRLRNPGAT